MQSNPLSGGPKETYARGVERAAPPLPRAGYRLWNQVASGNRSLTVAALKLTHCRLVYPLVPQP